MSAQAPEIASLGARSLAPAARAVDTESLGAAAWIAAGSLYVGVTYPYQAQVQPWLGPFPQVTYVGVCLLGLAAVFQCGRSRVAPQYGRPAVLVLTALFSSMLVTLAVFRNPTVIREMLLLSFIASVLWGAHGMGTIRILRAFTYISAVCLTLALIVVGLFYLGVIDPPTWSLGRFNLAETNPLYIRSFNEDFEYYLPLWLALIPDKDAADQGFGLVFTRQPFAFMEPTDTWFFTAGLFCIAWADTRMRGRMACLVVFGMALAFSFAVSGVVFTFAAIVLAFAMAFGGRWLVLLAFCAGLGLLSTVPLEQLVAMIGSNKADQVSFYAQNVTVFSDMTLLGHSAAADNDAPLSYGFLVVIYRYGEVGAAVTLGAMAAFAAASWRILADAAALGWRRYPLFIGIFISLGMLVKYPGIVPSMPTLCLAAALSYRHLRTDTFGGRAAG